MKLEEITTEVLQLSIEECCRLYLEIREISPRDVEWCRCNPMLSKLFDVLHANFEGEAVVTYQDEYRKLLS